MIDEVGSMVAAGLHYWYEAYKLTGRDDFIPSTVRDEWEQYLRSVDEMDEPPERRHLRIHEGHCTFLLPEERRLITPNLIRASGGLVGTPDEIQHRLRESESAGLKEVTLLPPMASARACFEDFATHVMAHY